MSAPSFHTLPSEIIYRILDYLDAQTILLSIRYVCRRFQTITNNYDRYSLNFQSISKVDFHLICRLIFPENVTSLTLSNEDRTQAQIGLFLSFFPVNQLVRLRSLTLVGVEDIELNTFLLHLNKCLLTSLSVDTRLFTLRSNTALTVLSSTIAKRHLRKLVLNMWTNDMKEMQWPISCMINDLRIVHNISFKQFCLILRQSPQLQTFILSNSIADESSTDIACVLSQTTSSFPQLKSFTCENGPLHMIVLEACLSLTPALVHLKLTGSGDLYGTLFDGYQWTKLIQTKLPRLEKFEFFFESILPINYFSVDVESLMSPFRTMFWLEDKHWFVTCDNFAELHVARLYSLPVCRSRLDYNPGCPMITCSTCPEISSDATTMDNVRRLDVNLNKLTTIDCMRMNQSRRHPLFRNVTELTLLIDGQWPTGALEFLSTHLDLSRIVQLWLRVNFSHECMPSIVANIGSLFERAHNICSLLIHDYWAPYYCTTTMENICSMVPSHVKHLTVRVKNLDDVKFALERLEHLSSVTFAYLRTLSYDYQEIVEWLRQNGRYSTQWESKFALHLWPAKNKSQKPANIPC